MEERDYFTIPAFGIGILDQKIAGKAREVNSGVWALGSFATRDHLLCVQEVIWNGFPAFFTGYLCLGKHFCSPIRSSLSLNQHHLTLLS
jgi:hypothetical protein